MFMAQDPKDNVENAFIFMIKSEYKLQSEAEIEI